MRRVSLPNSASRRAPRIVLILAAAALYLGASVSALRVSQAPAGAPGTVWGGVFTAEQAERGRTLFSSNCAECHGTSLEGGEGKALNGDQFWRDWGESMVGDLLTYVQTNMPFSEDGSKKGTLGTGTYVDIVTHILKANGFPAGMQELTPESSAGVTIIPKDGPGELSDATRVRVVGCLAPRGADGSWRVVRAARPRRASLPATDPDRDVPLGDRELELKFVLTSLNRFVGHRVAVTGLLIGTGGINGINISTVESVATTCN